MVASLRPQVARISDGPGALLSFSIPFLGAGLLRWYVSGESTLPYATLNLLLTIPIVRILTSWGPWRMVSIYLAISTVVDLVAVALLFAGVPFQTLRWPWTQIAEILMMIHVYWIWQEQPQPV